MAINDFLTKDEIDALLEDATRNQPASPGDPNEVVSYELVNPENTVKSIIPVLETVHERFAHRLQIGLFELLRRDVNVLANPVKMQAYADFITRLATPCSINIVDIKPLYGPGLLVLERQLVFVVVDTFFGGDGRTYNATSAGDFTLVEMRLIQRMLKLAWQALEGAWEPYASIKCLPQSSESNPQFVTALNPSETLVLFNLQVDLDTTIGQLTLTLPCSAFEPIRDSLLKSLTQERPSTSERLKRLLREGIQGSQVNIRCLLTETEITLRDLLHLKVGDVIAVEISPEARLEAEGVPVYAGQCGVSNGWRALKITETLTPLEDKTTDKEDLP